MKYLCQLWLDHAALDALPQAEKDEIDRASLAYDRELAERGHLVMARALREPSSALTVRVRSGKTLTTDGPFTEGREHLGGFILISARDFAEATQLAAAIPLAKYGTIEVRACWDLAGEDPEGLNRTGTLE